MSKKRGVPLKNDSKQIAIFEQMDDRNSQKPNFIQNPAVIISINKKQNEYKKELIDEVLKLSQHLQD
jgi:hypothetical protein